LKNGVNCLSIHFKDNKACNTMIDAEVLYSVAAIGTQILLTHKGKHVIVDIGDGTVRDLVLRKIEFGNIEGIVLTHEHFDHFSGLYGFLHFCRLLRRKGPLMIVAPKPVRVIGHLLENPVMYEPLPYEVRIIELNKGEHIDLDGMRVVGFPAKHVGANAFGYCFEDDQDFKVVVSGDTAYSDDIRRAVIGADVAFLEATYDESQTDLAERYGHMTKAQAEQLGALAKRAIYTHSNPEYYFRKFLCSSR
jgi:ribonuclease BN (tRNA processing enzyme)